MLPLLPLLILISLLVPTVHCQMLMPPLYQPPMHLNPWDHRNWADSSTYSDPKNIDRAYIYKTPNVPSRFGNGWFVTCTTKVIIDNKND
jgi:hypothetical protein